MALGAALVVGCGSKSDRAGAPANLGGGGEAGSGAGAGPGMGGSNTAGTSSVGGNAGAGGGTGGAAGGAGGATGGASGKAGGSGVGGAAGSGGIMQGPPPQLDGCPKDVVLGTSALTLTDPTPAAFSTNLKGPLMPGTPTFAVAVKNIDKASLNNDVSMTTLTFSAVNPNGGVAKFIGGKVPAPALATFADVGIQSPPTQGVYLRFLDEAGAEVLVPMNNAYLNVIPDKGCKSGTGSVAAVVLAADVKSTTVKFGGKTQPLADLFGPLGMGGQGMAEGWQLRFEFTLTELQFDLSTVP